jgi:hypothetical protein
MESKYVDTYKKDNGYTCKKILICFSKIQLLKTTNIDFHNCQPT